MCGICGFISKKEITKDILKTMNDSMYHRGPDDHGEEIYLLKNGYTLGLAQRRLSILDLSAGGHQPMHSKNNRLSLVYNGEIYNFQEIKEELKDYPFISNCDTEVIIAAYLKWGIKCIDKFNGMFAIALFDRDRDELYLVRDRIGKKPLYYWLDGENIVFASECKPIMVLSDFQKDIREELIKSYLYHQYINAPNTIFKNLYKVKPGEIVKYKYGKIERYQYWSIAESYKRNNLSKGDIYYCDAKEELKILLTDAIKKRMISDVPLGMFLSGGYDSTLVTAIAQSISDTPVKTFSIGFNENQYNEAEYAKKIAEYLGTEHTELYINEQDLLKLIEDIPFYYDEPLADASQIPTMMVSKLAREEVTVALSGDGGDELFCGYNNYTSLPKAQAVDKFGGLIYGIAQLSGIRESVLEKHLPNNMKKVIFNRDKRTKTQYGLEAYDHLLDGFILNNGQKPIKYDETEFMVKNWQTRRMLLDQATYLPEDILCKIDRASMKYSLECRCPILDYRVIEYSHKLPHRYKYKNGSKKYILKDMVYDYVPKELMERPKVGFRIPLDKWMHSELKEQLLAYSEKDLLVRQGIFNPVSLRNFIERYFSDKNTPEEKRLNCSRILWSFLIFQKWYEAMI